MMAPDWLCPRHRELIRHDADAALQLWCQLEWLADNGQLASPRLQLARWHVALDICDALRRFGRSETRACLLHIAQTLVPAPCEDDCLLLRLHEQLTVAVEPQPVSLPGFRWPNSALNVELAGWLSLLEHRLSGSMAASSAALSFAAPSVQPH